MDNKETGVQSVQARIEKFSDTHRETALRLHAIIMEAAPQLRPRLWYGMPGYALQDNGPVILFFREDKYISFGLTESTDLTGIGNPDEQPVEVAWYMTRLNQDIEAKIADIVRKVTT